MDALDLKILATLDADARRPYADVAREFGISKPTAADKVSRLEDSRILLCALLRVDQPQPSVSQGLRGQRVESMLADCGAKLVLTTGDRREELGDSGAGVEVLAEILQRVAIFADSSTSVVLETISPLRNPIPAQQPAAPAKLAARNGRERAGA
jgi:hypothetical protein